MIHVYLKLIPKVAYLTVSMAHLVCDALICLHLLCNCKQGSSVLALRRGECCDGLFLPAMWFVVWCAAGGWVSEHRSSISGDTRPSEVEKLCGRWRMKEPSVTSQRGGQASAPEKHVATNNSARHGGERITHRPVPLWFASTILAGGDRWKKNSLTHFFFFLLSLPLSPYCCHGSVSIQNCWRVTNMEAPWRRSRTQCSEQPLNSLVWDIECPAFWPCSVWWATLQYNHLLSAPGAPKKGGRTLEVS